MPSRQYKKHELGMNMMQILTNNFSFIKTKGNDDLYCSVSINKTAPFIIQVDVDDFCKLHTLAMTTSWLHKFLGQDETE